MTQYDVELYQRIEHLLGQKLPLYPLEENDVLSLQERVTEAQRIAKMVIHEIFYLPSIRVDYNICSFRLGSKRIRR